ncbi:MAG: cysteine synthase [Desulfatitalea sp.]|nr:cysteine synthase [Desulfatitalea sp.]NNK01315.1 cysteine synthase [Desulfatitalea sp.]
MTTSTILDLIGNTPLVALKRMNPNSAVPILAKLEYMNPGGSIKDRAALHMIETAEQSGQLTPEKTVVEATSGNTGIGLAMVCAIKGYKLLLTMSETASVERQKILQARGAQIRLTPGHLGTDGAIEEAYRLAREYPDKYLITDQFNNAANWQAHYHGTANEIWSQTQGQVTAVVATLGTSGTLMGLSRRFKQIAPQVRIIGVEPYLGHKIQGLKNLKESYIPEIFEKDRLDEKINIDDEEAFETARRLAREEGLLVGMSSGAAVAVALRQAAAMRAGMIVVILPDSGERYLSTTLFVEREKVGLNLCNTRIHARELFTPQRGDRVTLYTNGPTAHAPIHVGDARRFVFADLVDRYLSHRGYAVVHVMNITDLDEKIFQGAEALGIAPSAFTQRHITTFEADRDALGLRTVEHYPRSSAHADDMVQVVQALVGKGYAYEKLRSLYFDISRFEAYGRLSGIDLNKIKLGATVDLEEYEKDNPRDFTLLKRVKLSELKKGLYTKTPWGNVQPSWPLQCATLAMKYLGDTCDIHIAGRELLFPFNENEIAIAGALNKKPLANFWLHCDRVLVDGKKVDEKSGALTVRNFLDQGWTGREIRFLLLSTHYSKPVVFSHERLNDARRTLQRLDRCVTSLHQIVEGTAYPDIDQLLYDLKSGFNEAMEDDLNISAALAVIFKIIKQLNRLISKRNLSPEQVPPALAALENVNAVLGIFQFEKIYKETRVQQLLHQRAQARKAGDFVLADRLRNQLDLMGVQVRDGKAASGSAVEKKRLNSGSELPATQKRDKRRPL